MDMTEKECDALGEVARIVEDLAHEIEILRARVAAVEGRK